ncbi:MAG TPA: class I SAM-dependent methyltransferase [Acidimicrobiales bacterium]|nr:class I SAM-dependent methyltransferase [Acidimicrobiales bacterium]
MSSRMHRQAWEDWGSVDPLYAVLTAPQYRHRGGDRNEFFQTGEEFVTFLLGQCYGLGLIPHSERALDFGCGVGRVTAPLCDRFDSVLGLDVAASMVDTARKLHADRPHCRFEVHGGDDLSGYGDGSFDLVVSVLVLQHLSSEQAILRYLGEFVRVLRPGGALVVQLPSKVPPPPTLPPWSTRDGLRKRAAPLLRRLGVSAELLYRRLDYVPEMTMTGVPEALIRETLTAAGGNIVYTTPPDVDRGGTESHIFFVTR